MAHEDMEYLGLLDEKLKALMREFEHESVDLVKSRQALNEIQDISNSLKELVAKYKLNG